MYDPTPLTLEELVDHCRALAYAIIELDNALAKELLNLYPVGTSEPVE
nr:hypothetical protein PJ912_10285 [Pectobacterium colocasium]